MLILVLLKLKCINLSCILGSLFFYNSLIAQTLKWSELAEGAPIWTYLSKPPENECENGHHTCDDTHEECVDTLEGFECRCKHGYKMIKLVNYKC